jgi:hypothetical protein
MSLTNKYRWRCSFLRKKRKLHINITDRVADERTLCYLKLSKSSRSLGHYRVGTFPRRCFTSIERPSGIQEVSVAGKLTLIERMPLFEQKWTCRVISIPLVGWEVSRVLPPLIRPEYSWQIRPIKQSRQQAPPVPGV